MRAPSRPHGSPIVDAAADVADVSWYRRVPVQRRLRLVGRLAQMHPREIVHRIAKVAAKHAARWRGNEPDAPAEHRPLPAPFSSPTTYLLDRTSPYGFFAASERAARGERCRDLVPGDVARTVREADAVMTDGITLLGHVFRPAAHDFDWHADPTRGRLWPLVALDDNDVVRGVNADVKLVWEVNRHQFLPTLARAGCYTGDERYARACVAMVRSWIDANPTGLGVNWSSNLEVAIRLTSWVWTLHWLVGTPALDDATLRTWLTNLRAHRDHVGRHLSIYTDATNHLIGEAAALAIVSLWLPELDDSERWLATTIDVLGHEIERQVAEDGVGHEQATSYQRYVLDWMLQVTWLADRNDVALPPVIRARTRAMLDALTVLVGPRGRAPRIGDSDHARAVPFFTEDYWRFDEILALGAATLGTRPVTDHESVLWMTGATAAATATAPAPVRSHVFREGGYAVLRSAPNATPARLVFDCGPLGYLPHASHGHADLLSVLVDVGDEEMLIDPGTFAYWDEHGRRDLFRATRSHNTVEVGGRDQADGFDPFMWLNIPANGLATAEIGDSVQYVEAWHDGYRRLRVPVRHRRGVLGVPGGWLVVDWLEGYGTHRFTRWFHAAPETRIAVRSDAADVRSATGDAQLTLCDLRTEKDAPSVITVVTAPYSERYGEELRAPVVRFDDHAALPALRVTTIVPAQASSPAPTLRVEKVWGNRAKGTLVVRLITGTGARLHVALCCGARFGGQRIVVTSEGAERPCIAL